MKPTDVSRVHFIMWPLVDCERKALNGSRAMALMDNARLDFVCRTGMLKAMLKNGWLIVIASQRITYLKAIPVFSRVTVEARILSWYDRWFICECKIFYKGELAAIGHQRGVLRGRKGTASAAEILAAAGHNERAPSLTPELQEWIAFEDKLFKHSKTTAKA